ncbi:hypothetical protein MK805_16935 [Shimazuella sp. AN120528]|uniref:hypothetical protein n=1 Tax=Shimazuella soli TaxID=1892854 RepID=UPI001F0D1907|nr:hypothetical protein [Shimazuella soli]MCH5586623.1 hypothetical protein [Shimazuella soli]
MKTNASNRLTRCVRFITFYTIHSSNQSVSPSSYPKWLLENKNELATHVLQFRKANPQGR